MPVHNADVAAIFREIADLLEIKGGNAFRVRAYRNAARTIRGLSQTVSELLAQGEDLSQLPGIGKDLAGKIERIVETGDLPLLKKLKGEFPEGLSNLLQIPGLGPKRVQTIHKKLDISSLGDLQKAAREHRIRELSGFGKKTEESILEGIEHVKERAERRRLADVEEIADSFVAYLKKTKGLKDIEVAGSYRRRKETVGDLDILVSCKRGTPIMKRFVNYEDVDKVVSQGDTGSTVLLRSGLQVDLRKVAQVSYGAALLYFTGSKSHNIAVRKIGQGKKLKINEYGVFKGKNRVAGKTEPAVYKEVGLPYIEPELREDRGEIEAAKKKRLPELITLGDIKGDLHAHTKRTDGKHSLKEMAQAAKDKGYEYLAITEHSQRVTVAHGLDARALGKQIEEIDRLNDELEGIRLLKSIEVDILEDGSLDLPDDILKELDFTVCSVHSKFNLSRKRQTERILRAMDNPHFTILGHPTGRMIGEREPYDMDMERIMKAAKDRGCFLELNAHPDRLDLNDRHCKHAKEIGLRVVISTDAHSTNDLDFMRFGVGQARRGWLEPKDVLNTRSWKPLEKLLKTT